MNTPRQHTIATTVELEGIGLHTGEAARLRFQPAGPDSGIVFRRTDLPGSPAIRAALERVTSTDRGTSLADGEASVHTVEHVLAAVAALRIDNLVIELNGPEVPIGDGSFEPFQAALIGAGVEEQPVAARELIVVDPVSSSHEGGATYVAAPADRMRVSATIEFEHPLVRRQFGSFDVTPEDFAQQIARARTFGFMKEAQALRERGLARGVTLDNAVILNDEGIESGELRYPDEFVRHKIGDIIGDLALLGRRLRGHVVAHRPSHAGNLEFARALATRSAERPIVDIQKIMQHLPHRYPMLLVDRVVEFEPGRRIVGIKNVTINEPFFQGHYPGHPVMPGVLIIEAMAQVGGLLLMDAIENPAAKVVYFMSLDKVKWRRPVTPGDQLRFELEMLQMRRHVCRMRGIGLVDGQLVAEAEMMARIVDR